MVTRPPRANDQPAVSTRQRMLGLALAAVASFALLTVLVRQHPPALVSLDRSVHESLRELALAHGSWLSTMWTITHLGDTAVVAAVDLIALTACLVLRRYRDALFVAVVAVGVWSLRLGARNVIGRSRPTDALWPAEGLSFPSGHTANSAAMAVVVVVTCWPYLPPPGRRWLVAGAALVPLLVGFSRLAGGVHWPTDVLGGLLLAAAVSCGAASLVLAWADPPVRLS